MKFFILLCLSISLALGCSDLPELAVCEGPDIGEDCSCRSGLVCKLTKTFVVQGQAYPVKQCVADERVIEVENINMDEQKESAVARIKRFLPGLKGCRSGEDCEQNQCCPFLVHKCLPKLPELAECALQILHKCGCQDGLECQQTGTITLPIIGIKLPLLQCVNSVVGPPGGGDLGRM